MNPDNLLRLLAPGPLGLGDMIAPQTVASAGRQARQPVGPTGLAALLSRPGVQQGLLAAGSALLRQRGTPGGSFAAGLADAVPAGVGAYQQGQQEASLDPIIASMPPEMQALIRSLPPQTRAAAVMQMTQPGEGFTLSPGETRYDASGKAIASAPELANYTYRDRPDGTIAVISDGTIVGTLGEKMPDQVDYNDVTSLRKEYTSQVQQFQEVSEAFAKVQAAGAKDSPTAADDISLVFAYMKIVDPGSTVREGEQATARNAGSIPERIRAMYNRAINGQQLDVGQRANFVQAAGELVQSQIPLYEQRAQRYTEIAQRNGFDPADVVFNPFEGLNLSGNNKQLEDPLGIR